MVTTIRATLELLHEPGAVVELRMPHTHRGTVAGYFDNFDVLAERAAEFNGVVDAVYITINPVRPELLGRCTNRLGEFVRHTTGDADILRRRWLLIDFDPRRPAGISSSDEEHQLALDRAQRARVWLRERGWTGSILADSGNGAHLDYKIDLPNDDASTLLLRRCLQALDLHFSDDRVAVDMTTANAARLVKLYGTLACKGDHRPDRPHRLSRIIDIDGAS